MQQPIHLPPSPHRKKISQLARATALTAAVFGSAACSTFNAHEPSKLDWPDYLGGPDSSQYSPLDQVNRANVGSLVIAWSYDFPDNAQSIGNPLVIGERLYVPSSAGVTALDAVTGRELWRVHAPGITMRGLTSWASPDGKSRRLFYHRNDRLYAIDSATGAAIPKFGDGGSIDLKLGLGRDPAKIPRIEPRSPGRIFGNLIIVGSTGGMEWDGPPGHIRAYDVLSGKLIWKFHTIPQPGEVNYEDWPKDAWKTVGGANNWSEMTIDVANEILFVPLGSARYNFYGANRPGNNLYANSLVALDARTGRRLWHFQTVHHDLWDYDLPQAPKLLTLTQGGRRTEAVMVAGKTGFIYTFERRTGRPVFPIEEKPVPQTDVPGEWTSPTQPFPSAPPPFARQHFDGNELSPYLPKGEHTALQEMLAGMRNEGMFTPPSLQGTITMPGTSGGTNWGNGAVDPRTGRFFVVSIEVPGILRLQNTPLKDDSPFMTADAPPGAAVYGTNCANCHGAERQGQPPAIASLTDIAKSRSVDEVREIIQRGRATMPGFNLKEKALADLLSYLGFAPPAVPAGTPDMAEADEAKTDPNDPIKYKSGYNFLFSKMRLPANAPPWATVTAYDMNAGTLLWQVPFGELPMMKGAGSIFPRGTLLATAGGLLIAANQDRTLRVWDMDTGKVIFTTPLPSVPGGVPAAYMAGDRQFIAVPVASYDPALAKSVSKALMPEGRNSIVVYALPAPAGKQP